MDVEMSESLNVTRNHVPNEGLVRKLSKDRVFGETRPWELDCQAFYRSHPDGVIVGGKLTAVAELSERVFNIFHRNSHAWREVPAWSPSTDEIETISLAVGCRVMVRYSCVKRRGLVNGTMGYVMHMARYTSVLQLDSGLRCHLAVRPDVQANQLGFPLALAYAVTVAKMQGRTLNAIAISPDLRSPGLAYPVITRTKSLRHLCRISKPTTAWFCHPSSVFNDPRVKRTST